MNPKFYNAVKSNDITTFLSLVKENGEILHQITADSLSTPLHLASRYGCTEIVSEIVRLCPDIVSAENKNLETPIHEACRQENVGVLKLLLDANSTAICKLNQNGKSACFLACRHGNLDMLNLLLNLSEMGGPEATGFDQSCIHIAASRGHTGRHKMVFSIKFAFFFLTFTYFCWKVPCRLIQLLQCGLYACWTTLLILN